MIVAHSIASISRAVLDLFYPPTCPGCGRDVAEEPDPICHECWHRLTYLSEPFCQTCGSPTQDALPVARCDQCPGPSPAFDRCRSVVLYCDTMKRILHAYKFDGRRRLSRPLSRLLLWMVGRGPLRLQEPADPAGLPLVVLFLGLLGWATAPIQNGVSRAFEREADIASLELSGQPEAFIRAEQKLAISNKSNVAPTALNVFLFASHPPPVERILLAKLWRDNQRRP